MEGGDVAAASPPVDFGGEAREARKPAKAPDAGVVKERKPSPSGVGVVRRAAPPPGAPGGGRPEAPLLPGGAGKEKDLMKMVVQQNKKQAAANADMCAIMVGTASCGKSTLLKGLKNNDEEPKPTLALEYSFLRKINAADGRKDVAHLWEIGGGTAMQNMLDVPLTESSVKTATVVIVADLSQPDELFVGVSYWLERLRLRMQDIDKVFKSKEATARLMDQLKERSAKRFGEKHPDNLKDGKEGTWGRGMIKHTGVNVIIVATKWDLFAKKDPELKKVMGRCLRFLAHMNGASLLYCGQGEKMLVDKFRAILSHYLFKAPAVKTKETNHLKPLVVPAGSDSLEVTLKNKSKHSKKKYHCDHSNNHNHCKSLVVTAGSEVTFKTKQKHNQDREHAQVGDRADKCFDG